MSAPLLYATRSLINTKASTEELNIMWIGYKNYSSIYKSLRSNKEINVTNGTFTSSSIKTDIIPQLLTRNNKKIYQIEGNIITLKPVHIREDFFQIIFYKRKKNCVSVYSRNLLNQW